jgi:hypothetical protein
MASELPCWLEIYMGCCCGCVRVRTEVFLIPTAPRRSGDGSAGRLKPREPTATLGTIADGHMTAYVLHLAGLFLRWDFALHTRDLDQDPG